MRPPALWFVTASRWTRANPRESLRGASPAPSHARDTDAVSCPLPSQAGPAFGAFTVRTALTVHTFPFDVLLCTVQSARMAHHEPPPNPDIRDTRVVIYMTREDSEHLFELAEKMGFKGRSEMIVAILERLLFGGFAVMAWLKTGLQFAKRMEQSGCYSEGRMYFGVRPLPALPVEDSPSRDEMRKAITGLKREIETKPIC